MKLHPTAIKKIIDLFHVYGGSQDEVKLKQFILNLDFTPYEQKTTKEQNMVLVLTEDYVRELQQKKG